MSVDATRWVWNLCKKIVTPSEKLILLSMADRSGERGECWPSNSRLEKDTGYERRTIIRTRKSLIEKGLIQYTGEMKGRSSQIPVIRLMIGEWREGICEEIDEPVTLSHPCTKVTGDTASPVPVTLSHPSRVTLCHPEPKRIEPKIRINKKTTTTASKQIKAEKAVVVVISEDLDKKILNNRLRLEGDNRSDIEFLKQCLFHLQSGDNVKFNQAQRVAGLMTLVKSGQFLPPAVYVSESQERINKEAAKKVSEGIKEYADYQEFIGRLKSDIMLGIRKKITPPTFEEWKCSLKYA